MPYPGGAALDKAAAQGDEKKYSLPLSRPGANPYDMSFSGLKTAVINLVHNAEQKGEEIDRPALAASFTRAVSESLVPRTIMAAKELKRDKIVVAGGVAANSPLRSAISDKAADNGFEFYCPSLILCTDNAAMIGCSAYYEYQSGKLADSTLNAIANLSLED